MNELIKHSLFQALLICALTFMLTESLHAQGDGPRTYMLSPKGLWGVNPKWMSMNQNFLPSGNILVKDADLTVNVFPTTFFHSFGIKGRFAQVMFMVNPGSANGTLVSNQPGFPAPQVNASGFSDGFVAMKLGLINAPVLNLKEFAERKPAFTMLGYFRVWYSGTYDRNKPLNLGTNRTTFEVGIPMTIPLFKNLTRPILWEAYPYVQLYTMNHDPTIITQAEKSHQLPLMLFENHVTHNFTSKFWAGIDLRYQYGGVGELDGEKQDNKINIFGGGISAGYQILSFLSTSASYGTIFIGDNDAQSDLFRLSAVFVYANTKKINSAK